MVHFLPRTVTYLQYVASLFADNGQWQQGRLVGNGQECSLLAAFMVAYVGGIWVLYFCRARVY